MIMIRGLLDDRIKNRSRDERGMSVCPFVVVIMMALIMTTGLVVDGGQKVAAASRAESVAASASRIAGNAAAAQELSGRDPAAAAVLAARAFLAGQPDVHGSVAVSNGVVTVRTETSEPTIFLTVIGIARVNARGSADANIVPTGQVR
jgi:hypothetical protein